MRCTSWVTSPRALARVARQRPPIHREGDGSVSAPRRGWFAVLLLALPVGCGSTTPGGGVSEVDRETAPVELRFRPATGARHRFRLTAAVETPTGVIEQVVEGRSEVVGRRPDGSTTIRWEIERSRIEQPSNRIRLPPLDPGLSGAVVVQRYDAARQPVGAPRVGANDAQREQLGSPDALPLRRYAPPRGARARWGPVEVARALGHRRRRPGRGPGSTGAP